MKHIKLASAAAIAMGLAFAGSASAQSNSGGTITFTGSVSDATCTVSGGAGTNNGTGNFIVALDQAQVGDLDSATKTANPKNFNVQIGGPGQGSCTDGTIATMTFVAGNTVDPATGALINQLSGEATNTQIQLLDATGNVIDLAANSYSATATVANNTATIPFTAQYLATGAATPGLVSTDVVYGVTFN